MGLFKQLLTSSASIGTVESYTARIDGTDLLTVYAESDGAGGIQNARIGIGTASPTAKLDIAQTITAAGALKGIVYTGAINTNQTLSTEIPSLTLTTAGRQWATGALATQREVLITQPTYSFVGASAITDAATLGIAGAPIAGTNATLTNSHGLLIQAGAVAAGTTNSYGLTVNAQTGATNNYAAAFMGGNVGIGTATPSEKLTIRQDLAGNLLGLYDGANNTTLAVADGGQTVFKPAAFDTVYTFDGAAAYADNTAEAKTSVGTAFTVLALEASSNDEFYLGLDHPFNTVYFDIAAAGAGVTLSAQYYSTAWTALTLTADNTTNLTVDGAVTFAAPTGWAATAINGVTKYWIRLISPATNITTAPTAYSVSPTTGNRFYVYGQSGDTAPALYVNDKGNVGIGTTSPTQSLSIGGNAILTGTMGINNAGIISGRGINYSSANPSQTTYGMYNSLDTPASNYGIL